MASFQGRAGSEGRRKENRPARDISPKAVASAAPKEAVDPADWRWLK